VKKICLESHSALPPSSLINGILADHGQMVLMRLFIPNIVIINQTHISGSEKDNPYDIAEHLSD